MFWLEVMLFLVVVAYKVTAKSEVTENISYMSFVVVL